MSEAAYKAKEYERLAEDSIRKNLAGDNVTHGFERAQVYATLALALEIRATRLETETGDVPTVLAGDDGEVIFVRRDAAPTQIEAVEVAIRESGLTGAGNMSGDEVEMRRVPDYFTGLGYEWATVKPGTPGAIRFWRLRA